MKQPFSLLQALQDAPQPSPTPAKQEYHVYIIESEGESRQIGVPLSNMEAFEAHFSANPADLSDIEQHLAAFGAIVV